MVLLLERQEKLLLHQITPFVLEFVVVKNIVVNRLKSCDFVK